MISLSSVPSYFKSPKRLLITALIFIVAVGIVAGGVVLFKSQAIRTGHPLTSTNGSTSSTQPTPSQSVGVTATPYSLPSKSGLESYVSQANKLGFYYEKGQGSQAFAVKESGNMITIYQPSAPNVKQYVQIFPKATSDTIQQAVQKAVLSGYSLSNCVVTPYELSVSDISINAQVMALEYAPSEMSNSGPFPIDPTVCPEQYTINRDVKYFAIDQNHPDKLLFFNLGQFVIGAGTDSNGNSLSWDLTVTDF